MPGQIEVVREYGILETDLECDICEKIEKILLFKYLISYLYLAIGVKVNRTQGGQLKTVSRRTKMDGMTLNVFRNDISFVDHAHQIE